MLKKTFIISLGGSLVNSGKIDVIFLKKFRALILNRLKGGNKFIIITGGGQPARDYQAALTGITKTSASDLDWMGIFLTRANAQLVRLMFGKLAHEKIVEDPNKILPFKKKILVAGGWTPGRSTDDDAVRLAKIYGAKIIINLSNIDYVYTKDPRKFRGAKKIEKISWIDFKKIIGYKWLPGKNLPFDPVAAKLAQKNKLKVIIADGKDLKNLEKILQKKKFKGTIIN